MSSCRPLCPQLPNHPPERATYRRLWPARPRPPFFLLHLVSILVQNAHRPLGHPVYCAQLTPHALVISLHSTHSLDLPAPSQQSQVHNVVNTATAWLVHSISPFALSLALLARASSPCVKIVLVCSCTLCASPVRMSICNPFLAGSRGVEDDSYGARHLGHDACIGLAAFTRTGADNLHPSMTLRLGGNSRSRPQTVSSNAS